MLVWIYNYNLSTMPPKKAELTTTIRDADHFLNFYT